MAEAMEYTKVCADSEASIRRERVPAHGMNLPDVWVIPSIFIIVRPILQEMKCRAHSVTAANTPTRISVLSSNVPIHRISRFVCAN